MEFEYEAVLPAILTSVVAYTVYALVNGWSPMFTTSGMAFDQPRNLVLYLLLGASVAAMGWLYVTVFYGLRDRVFARLPGPRVVRPAVGGPLTGLVGLVAPQAVGLGYGWVQMGMLGHLTLRDYRLGAFGKILATGFTISSGGSGGVFGPAVVIGGFTGGAVGTVMARLLPTWHIPTANFILVGMAAFFGGAAKAPIGALLMISEMTLGYGLLVPLMLACAVAVALVPKRVSIYEEQVDGMVNSPAHFPRYLAHVSRALGDLSSSRTVASGAAEGVLAVVGAETGGEVGDRRLRVVPLGDVTVLDVRVREGSKTSRRFVRELPLGEGVLLVAVRRGDQTLLPSGDTVLMPGDHVVVMTRPDRTEHVLEVLGR